MIEWHEEPLASTHDRAPFDCGVEELDTYLRQFARQNHERGGARTFVAVPADDPTRILGYYTFAATSVEFDRVPSDLRRGMGRYPVLMFLLARLAVDRSMQGHRLGHALVMKAGAKALALAPTIGGVGMLVDAIDENAARWYQRFGARPLPTEPLSLVISFGHLRGAIDAADQ